MRRIILAAILTLTPLANGFAQHEHNQHEQNQGQHDNQATHEEHQKAMHAHHAGVDQRGDERMGFRHDLTKHTFVLTETGGRIEVRANSTDDAASREQIRTHLQQIAKQFAEGDFSSPMFIHDKVPPGVDTMKAQRAKLSYTYEELPQGARVVIRSKDKAAIAAVHNFLRFQISDHRTGDKTSP